MLEPPSFVAGDTVSWTVADLSDYPIADGWRLQYALRGPDPLDITAVNTTGQHVVTIAAATTASLAAGRYRYAAYVRRDNERHTIETGDIDVAPNLTEAEDGRTHDERMVANLEAQLEELAAQSRESMSVDGRSQIYRKMSDVRAELAVCRERVRQQRGGSFLQPMAVRFARP